MAASIAPVSSERPINGHDKRTSKAYVRSPQLLALIAPSNQADVRDTSRHHTTRIVGALGLKALDTTADDSYPVVHPVLPPLPELHQLRRDEVAAPVGRHRDPL